MVDKYAKKQQHVGYGCFIFLFGSLLACNTLYASNKEKQQNQLTQLETKLNNYRNQLESAIAGAPCTSTSQCRALPIGSRPCGGPSEYITYSKQNANKKQLKVLAQQHSMIHRQINRIKGLISTCEMVLQPPIACVDSKCIIKK